jgi:hypothetical protein
VTLTWLPCKCAWCVRKHSALACRRRTWPLFFWLAPLPARTLLLGVGRQAHKKQRIRTPPLSHTASPSSRLDRRLLLFFVPFILGHLLPVCFAGRVPNVLTAAVSRLGNSSPARLSPKGYPQATQQGELPSTLVSPSSDSLESVNLLQPAPELLEQVSALPIAIQILPLHFVGGHATRAADASLLEAFHTSTHTSSML